MPIAARRGEERSGEERRPLTAVDKPTCHSPQRNRIIQTLASPTSARRARVMPRAHR